MWHTVDAVFAKALYVRCPARQEPEVEVRWRSAAKENLEMSRYFPKNTKTGDFHPQRTHSGSLFVILERLASIRAVVLAFTTNKQTLSIIYN